MERVRLGLVGCGRIAEGAHLPALREVDSIELAATCSRSLSRAEEVAEAWGAGPATDSLEEICGSDGVDAVLLCLPHHLHKEAVVAAARAGKHVLVEKPLGLTVAECDEMISVAEAAGVVLMVGQVMRFSAEFRAIRERIDSGEIGAPMAVRGRRLTYQEKAAAAWWASADMCGGLVIPLIGAHIFDTIFWLTGGSPKRVFAVGRSVRDIWEGEDEADISMTLDNGVTATVALSFNCRMAVNDLVVVGSGGALKVAEEDLVVDEQREGPIEKFVVQLKEFAGAILEGRAPLVGGQEGRRVVAAMEGARRSMETGEVVEL